MTTLAADENRIPLELGRCVLTFGNLEFLIHSLVWLLIADDSARGRAITEQLLDRPLGELLERLSNIDSSGPSGTTAVQRREAGDIAREFVKMLPERNAVIHALWASPQPTGEFPGRHIRTLARSPADTPPPDAPFTADALVQLRLRLNPLLTRAAGLQMALNNLIDRK